MGPKKASMCKTCRQDFSDERKQKGTSIQCGQCFYFIKSHPIYKGMPSKQLQEELADDEKFGTYLTGLTEWEENRQAGKSRSRTQSVTTSAETKASMHTRSLKGYLWTKELCEKKGCGELFKSRSKCLTSVQHMGKTVTGILRDVNCLGAIEIYEDSSVSAIRSNVAGEADAMDCDAVSEQNQLFTNLIQQIKSQETEDGDGNSGLKAAARKDDDFLDLWGVSSSVGGPSSSNRNRGSEGTCAEASRPPKKQKITKKLAAGVVGQPSTSDSADTASQSGQASASSLSSSWMFSGRLNMKGGKAKQSEHHKDFEQTERAIAQVEQLKVAVTNPASYLGLTFAKCRSVLEKIQSRNTDALQKLYRESGLNGDAQGLDLLKRTCECCKQASAIVDVVSALHDPESSAETLASALADARLENVDVPQNADQICHARLLTELSKAQNWSEYFKQIDVDHVKPVFGDGVEDDSLLDFQASSLLTAMRSILMQEVKLDNAPSDEKEAAKQLILLQDKMILAGSCFIDGFFDANIAKFMEDKPNVSNLFEDMLKFKIVFAALLRSKERRLGDAEIEALKGARQHLIGNKKGLFYETLTLFPLGQCVAGKAADIVNAAYHDKGLIAELDSVVESLSTLKPFTQDSILRKVIKDTVADFEIQIPMSNKMFDVVSKYSMICITASEHFRSERHRDLDAVGAKIDELSLALHAAVSTKFCNRHGTSIIDGITALLDGKMDVQKSTEFCKALESAASFVPFNKALVNKALGETRGAVLNQFLQDNKEFYTKISGATSVLFPFLESQAEVGASTLLTPSLVPLIEAMQNETMLANVPKMVPKLMWPLKRLQQKILSAAKVAMARETASVITLMSKFQDGEVDLNALMDTNLVGAVVESEGDETTLKEVNFGRIYELYFAKINSDGNADANKCYIENGSEKLEVSPTVLCAGKVIHHVLRNIAHLSGIMKEASEKPPMVENLTPPKASKLYVGCKLQHLVDSGAKCVSKCIQSLQEATTSLETIPCDVAKSSLQQCKEKLGDQIKLFVTDLSGEVSGVQRHIQQVLPKLLDEFKLSESLESDSYDPSMVKAACADARVQILYHLMCLGKPGILSALSTLQSMAMICKNFAELPVYSAAATWTDAVIADVSKFAEGDLKNQSGLAFTGYALGNITLAQSVYRELSTGETRQNLVFKALNGVKARGFKCNQKLLQKCEAILKGHGSKQAK